MDYETKSILEELTAVAINQHKDHYIESTGNNIIHSAINFINKLHSTYGPETALDLEKRMINSIKSGDPAKFERGIKKVKR